MLNNQFATISALACLLAWSVPVYAETKTEWAAASLKGRTELDDTALMEVSARGAIDENAVKVLQTTGKLADYASTMTSSGNAQSTGTLESAEKAAQNQFKTAMGVTQTVINTTQLTGTVASMAAPISPAPLMSLPMFGLPSLPSRPSN